jgi:hypothetical protein
MNESAFLRIITPPYQSLQHLQKNVWVRRAIIRILFIKNFISFGRTGEVELPGPVYSH